MPERSRCQIEMNDGVLKVRGLLGGTGQSEHSNHVEFLLPGTDPTDSNPVEAFKQSLADADSDRRLTVVPFHCPRCGMLELLARPR